VIRCANCSNLVRLTPNQVRAHRNDWTLRHDPNMDRGRSDKPGSSENTLLGNLRLALSDAVLIEDQTERLLEGAAIIAEAVADLGVNPVVVGGLAVAYWSRTRYTTGEIDFLMPKREDVIERLEALGFEQSLPRHWVFDQTIAFEAPGAQLDDGDEAEPIKLASGRTVLIMSIEDMVLWRVREFLHWKDSRGFRHVLYMLGSSSLDRQRLEHRARETGLAAALRYIERAADEIRGGRRFETWEIKEAAEQLGETPPTIEES
jgi:hypothetical protein